MREHSGQQYMQGQADSGFSKILSIGRFRTPTCGIGDYGSLLDGELERLGHSVQRIWACKPEREGWISALRDEARFFTQGLKAMTCGRLTAILHYCPFSQGIRGIPFLTPLLPLIARAKGIRMTVILHELCFPWRRAGVRGAIWAASQRIALLPLVTASQALVVTTQGRAEWLARKFPGSRQKVQVVPVWTNIPAGGSESKRITRTGFVFGSLGWDNRGSAVETILDALKALAEEGRDVRMLLIGGPGTDSVAGQRWRKAAAYRNVEGKIQFTSPALSATAVSEYLRGLDAYLHIDSAGPTPRRTSLAAALAHGKPIVAFSGPQTWSALRYEDEVLLSPQVGTALSQVLTRVMDSEELRIRLSNGAISAYKREMDLSINLKAICTAVLGTPAGPTLSHLSEC